MVIVIPPQIKAEYDLIISPHHGADTTIPDIIAKGEGIAIISAGATKRTVYPGTNHMNKLFNLGYKDIFVTQKEGNVFFCIK